MILRLTFGDNDCVHYIEDFCNNLRERMFDYHTHPELKEPVVPVNDCNSDEEMGAYLASWRTYFDKRNEIKNERRRLMPPSNHYKKNSTDYKIICAEVKRLWLLYVEKNNLGCSFDFIDISIRHRITEKDENGEVVYYFTAFDRTITM